MEPGVVILLTCLGLGGFALAWLRLSEARESVKRSRNRYVDGSRSPERAPAPLAPAVPRGAERQRNAAPEPAWERGDDPLDLTEDELSLTWEEVVRALATVKIIDDMGGTSYLPKKKIAALVGKRQEEVSAVIDAVRGTPPRRAGPLPADAPEAWEEDGPGRIVRVA